MTNVLLKEPLGAVSVDTTVFPDGYLVVSDDCNVSVECRTPGFRIDLSLSLNGTTAALSATTPNGWVLSAPVSHGASSSADAAETVVTFTPQEATLSPPGAPAPVWDRKELLLNGTANLASAKWSFAGYDFELVRARDQNGRKVMSVGLLIVSRTQTLQTSNPSSAGCWLFSVSPPGLNAIPSLKGPISTGRWSRCERFRMRRYAKQRIA